MPRRSMLRIRARSHASRPGLVRARGGGGCVRSGALMNSCSGRSCRIAFSGCESSSSCQRSAIDNAGLSIVAAVLCSGLRTYNDLNCLLQSMCKALSCSLNLLYHKTIVSVVLVCLRPGVHARCYRWHANLLDSQTKTDMQIDLAIFHKKHKNSLCTNEHALDSPSKTMSPRIFFDENLLGFS